MRHLNYTEANALDSVAFRDGFERVKNIIPKVELLMMTFTTSMRQVCRLNLLYQTEYSGEDFGRAQPSTIYQEIVTWQHPSSVVVQLGGQLHTSLSEARLTWKLGCKKLFRR